MFRAAACLLLTAMVTTPPVARAAYRHVVSTNLCPDELLIEVARPDQIASVSFLARDSELSFVADRAARFPVHHGQAELILEQHPDLVLAGSYGAQAAVRLVRSRNIPVVHFGMASTFPEIRAQILKMGRLLHRPQRANALVAEMESRLRAAAPKSGAPRPLALLLEANGFTAGSGTLTDSVLKAAGFRNLAAEAGLKGYGYLPLERIVAAQPDLLIVQSYRAGDPTLAQQMLSHPALSGLRRMKVDGRLWACGGPYTARAVTELAAARRRLEREP